MYYKQAKQNEITPVGQTKFAVTYRRPSGELHTERFFASKRESLLLFALRMRQRHPDTNFVSYENLTTGQRI